MALENSAAGSVVEAWESWISIPKASRARVVYSSAFLGPAG